MIGHDEDSRRGTWFNTANIGSSGIFIVAGGPLILRSPVAVGAAFMLMLMTMLLPIVLLLYIPTPPPDKLRASEGFGRFERAVLALLRRREALIGLALSSCSRHNFPSPMCSGVAARKITSAPKP